MLMKNIGSITTEEMPQNEDEKAKKVRNRPLFHVKVSQTRSPSAYNTTAQNTYT